MGRKSWFGGGGLCTPLTKLGRKSKLFGGAKKDFGAERKWKTIQAKYNKITKTNDARKSV